MNISRIKLAGYMLMAAWIGTVGLARAGQDSSNFEVILSATSTDGRTFTQDEGYRLENGYVDAHIIKVAANDWLMLVATTPSATRLPQQIYMARSGDGISWQVNTNALIKVPDGNALDPTAVDLGGGSYRVYYVGTSTSDPFSGFYLTSGVIQATSSTTWSFTPDNVSYGISCVSPEAMALGAGAVRLYVTSSAGGMKAYRADDGLAFFEESGVLPQGSDPSVIDLGNGQLRMYYVNQDPNGRKEIDTALSADGLDWTFESRTGITNSTTDNAWGVPDSFIDLEGKTKLFWVAMPSASSSPTLSVPIFSQVSGGITVGKIQPRAAVQSVNFLQLSDAEWGQYKLVAATAHMSNKSEIGAVIMDRGSQIQYLTHSVSNSCTDFEGLFGLTAEWSTYTVDAAADLDGDGFVEYMVRDRASGCAYLIYTENGANQVKTTGTVLGLDPSVFAGYRIEAAGDENSDGYADLIVRDLAAQILYLVENDRAGGYGKVLPLFGLTADIWAFFNVESTGDYNADGNLDLVIQDIAKTVSYKVFGTGSNSYSLIEYIP